MTSKTKVTVGVAQFAPVIMDVMGTMSKVHDIVHQAKDLGCKILLFPEAFFPCYPRGLSFGSVVGWRKDSNKDFQRYFESAIPIPGKISEQLGALARKTGMYLNMGLVERAKSTLYCSMAHYAPDGSLAGLHRKLCATTSERIIWGYGDGSHLAVVETPWGGMGGAICWENRMPLLRAALYAKGLNIYLAPTADFRNSWQSTVRHIAMESRTFVLSCNQYLTKSMYPTDLESYRDLESLPEVLTRGGSAIIDPFGEYIAGPLYDQEGLLTATLDMGLIPQSRFDFDPVGHYARPDVFQLNVNERPHTGTIFYSTQHSREKKS